MQGTTPLSGDLLVFWAKLPRGKDASPQFHPLLCHLIDVAMVVSVMWQEVLSAAARGSIASALEVAEDAAGRWVAFWAGLHDLGKCAPGFQRRDSEAMDRINRSGLAFPAFPGRGRHGTVSARVVPKILQSVFGIPPGVAASVGTVIGGHHGVFPSSGEILNLTADDLGSSGWERARRELAAALANVLVLPAGRPEARLSHPAAMVLGGLVSVADWIGSNETYFPYAAPNPAALPTIDVTTYAAASGGEASAALRRIGWVGWTPNAGSPSFQTLFAVAPRPIQEAAIELAEQIDGPALVVVEAPMGEGKTEAAMYLVDRFEQRLGHRGCYFALPTQATSTQMFGRVRKFLAGRYPASVVNLNLLHGHAALSAELEELQRNGDRLFAAGQVDGDGESLAGVMASQWFTYRKRGLLAPFGVGTVDQTLLAALQSRHVFVRLFGLADKTVIVDEVHAYDTYMSTLLERLLEWLAAIGTPVILLSATLPGERRQALLSAYGRGLGLEAAPAVAAAPYPRISWLARSTAGARHVGTSVGSARTLTIHWIDGHLPGPGEVFGLGERLRGVTAAGGCVAVICNTVRRAVEVYQALKPYFPGIADDGLPEIDLLHARYPYAERAARERRSLVRFGKPGGEVTGDDGDSTSVRRPERAVLVTTQIVEQSLDLDFDLMVTDMAPIDLILQRSGRLHRHSRPRPGGLTTPAIWIRAAEAVEDGVPRFDSGTGAVYDGHVLLRSWLALQRRAAIRVPEEVEELIEAAYESAAACPADAGPDLAVEWEETGQKSEEGAASELREARVRWLRPPGYRGPLWEIAASTLEEDDPEFHIAHQALTRLSEPTVAMVCLYGNVGHPTLDPAGTQPIDLRIEPDVPLAKRLLLASVPVSSRRVTRSLIASKPPLAWQRSALLRHHRMLVFDRAGIAEVDGHRLVIDGELGLVVESIQGGDTVISFNLVDEAWIPCLPLGVGPPIELGIREALARAAELREIIDPSPTVTIALHRLLLATLHRTFGPEDDAAWVKLWEWGAWDARELEAYFQTWRTRFDLFAVDRPFYQVASLEDQYKLPVAKLAHELASGGNPATLFDHGGEAGLSPARAARYLVAHQSFAVGGLVSLRKGEDPRICKSADAAPLTKGAVILVRGKNLFETLMLNLVRYCPEEEQPFRGNGEDRPAWESEKETTPTDREPAGYLDLLTWQSRRVRLCPDVTEDGRMTVPHVVIMKGHQFPDRYHLHGRETMLAFGRNKKAKPEEDPWPVVGFRVDRALWRDSLALLQSVEDERSRPVTVRSLANLVVEGVLTRGQVVPIDAFGIRTDPAPGKSANVLFWRHERLPVPLAYLDSERLLERLKIGLQLAEDVGRELERAVWLLAQCAAAPGWDEPGGKVPRREAVQPIFRGLGAGRIYWSGLEVPFREFLGALARDRSVGPEGEAEYGNRALPAWARTLFSVGAGALRTASEGLDSAPRTLKGAVRADAAFRRAAHDTLKDYLHVEGGEG